MAKTALSRLVYDKIALPRMLSRDVAKRQARKPANTEIMDVSIFSSKLILRSKTKGTNIIPQGSHVIRIRFTAAGNIKNITIEYISIIR